MLRFNRLGLNTAGREEMSLLRFGFRILHWTPFLFGLAVMYLLAAVPQSREVYLGIIEDGQYGKGLLGLALIGLLCLLIDSWQRMLNEIAIDRIYPEHANVQVDRALLFGSRFFCSFSSALPLVGLIAGLVRLSLDTFDYRSKFDDALKTFAPTGHAIKTFPEFVRVIETIPHLGGYAWVSIIFIILTVGALLACWHLFVSWNNSARALHKSLSSLVVWSAVLISGAAIVLPLIMPDRVVGITQVAGPLAGVAIVLIVLACLLMGLSYLSARYGFPVLGLLVIGLIGVMAYQTWSAMSPRSGKELASPEKDLDESPQTADLKAAHDLAPLHGNFDGWISKRITNGDWKYFVEDKIPDKGKYPVFIIAAQGGGIYAAAATSAFLSAMQDECRNFSQHVFAISAVSGGAVGAALFGALRAHKPLVRSAGCSDSKSSDATETYSQRTKDIVLRDHLSPPLALIWPDIVGKATEWILPSSIGRSDVLERSFACAYLKKGPWDTCPRASEKGSVDLRMPFGNYWRLGSAAPALILTSTWVETGFRAAFAPFPLHAISDGTLYSFPRAEVQEGQETHIGDFVAQKAEIQGVRRLSLIEAAFVSARFPGIVPAYQVRAKLSGGRDRVWNFVDGGYVDNSGATTALDLYQELKDYVARKGYSVELYVILLTESNTDPDVAKVEDGTRFRDTLAPITALLRVRSQLANRAVTSVIDEVQSEAKAEDLAARRKHSNVLIINLQQVTFPLPLGWKISKTTDDIIRLMLGRRDLCETRIKKELDEEHIARVIRDNSCVKKRLRKLLGANTPDQAPKNVP